MPAKIIPDKEVEMMWRRGMTPSQIKAALWRDHKIDVTATAISVWRQRRGLPPLVPRYEEFLPWRVLPEHAHKWPAKMLRLAARRASGGVLTAVQEKDLAHWLTSRQEADQVVGYERDYPGGWFYTTRRPKVDFGLILNPDVPL